MKEKKEKIRRRGRKLLDNYFFRIIFRYILFIIYDNTYFLFTVIDGIRNNPQPVLLCPAPSHFVSPLLTDLGLTDSRTATSQFFSAGQYLRYFKIFLDVLRLNIFTNLHPPLLLFLYHPLHHTFRNLLGPRSLPPLFSVYFL